MCPSVRPSMIFRAKLHSASVAKRSHESRRFGGVSDGCPILSRCRRRCLWCRGKLQERPPRSARTKCSVAPPSSAYSSAVLSSALVQRKIGQRMFCFVLFCLVEGGVVCVGSELVTLWESGEGGALGWTHSLAPRNWLENDVVNVLLRFAGEPFGGVVSCLHLLAAVDQALLRGWDAFLLFDALLYALDLRCADRVSLLDEEEGRRCWAVWRCSLRSHTL